MTGLVIPGLTVLAVLITAVTLTATQDWPSLSEPPRHKRRRR